ncbi:hypothetical protein SCHPADRAFT_948347 [Schizopora paradoxa]|uniref:Uncharacterized protein n=1 Tax=Schizopora paradoxa TaxID=27342 RepID=A0A0H2QWT4_9AGAM|nr:hypothetical protein SCHPADRAFT_948347 [Schizopora paradoxa]
MDTQFPSASISADLTCVNIGARRVRLEVMKHGLNSLVDAVESEFVNETCFGMVFPGLDVDVDESFENSLIRDNVLENALGYSFIHDPRNFFAKHRKLLLDAIMDKSFSLFTGRKALFDLDAGGHFDPIEVRRFFDQTDDFVQTLCGTIALTCGLPIAPADLAITRINVGTGKGPVVRHSGGYCVLSVQSTGPVGGICPRPLVTRVAKVLVKYLTIVVPVLKALLYTRFGHGFQEYTSTYGNSLFVRSGMVYTDEQVSGALAYVTERYCGGAITFEELRDIILIGLIFFAREEPIVAYNAIQCCEEDKPSGCFSFNTGLFSNSLSYSRLIDLGSKVHSFFGVGVPEVVARKDGKIGCSPNENVVVASLVSVRFLAYSSSFSLHAC